MILSPSSLLSILTFSASNVRSDEGDLLRVDSSFTSARILINRVCNKVNLVSFKTSTFPFSIENQIFKLPFIDDESSRYLFFLLTISSLLLLRARYSPSPGFGWSTQHQLLTTSIHQLHPPLIYKSSSTLSWCSVKILLIFMHAYIFNHFLLYLFPPNLCILNL